MLPTAVQMSPSTTRHLLFWLILGSVGACVADPGKGAGPLSPEAPAHEGSEGTTPTEVEDTATPPEDTGAGEDTGTTGIPCEADCDEDGYTVEEGDCDDSDPLVHPGAEDPPCTGVDEDCDGSEVTDADGDGWDCWQVGGEDCDDDNPDANPDGVEVEDNWVDDDCDGYADLEWLTERDPDVYWVGIHGSWTGSYLGERGIAVLEDLDGDGHVEIAATAIGGVYLLSSAGDVPSSVETDALGMIREKETTTWDFGQMIPISDLDGDGKAEVAFPTRGKDWQGVSVFTAATLGAGGAIDSSGIRATVTGDWHSATLPRLASTDIDADGVDDLLMAEWWDNSNHGRVARIAQSDLSAGADLDLEDVAQILWEPDRNGYRLGVSEFTLGDLDGDGYPTLVVSDYFLGTYLIDGDAFSSGGSSIEMHDLDITTIYLEDASIPDSGTGWYPVSVISPGDLDGDGHPDVLLHDFYSSLYLDGVKAKGGHVDVFLDLWEGGTTSYAAANAHITDTGINSSRALEHMAGPATIGHEDQDIVFTGKEGIFFVGTEEIPLTGILDLYQWPHLIQNEDSWTCSSTRGENADRALAIGDLDGDGDDDVVCMNAGSNGGLTRSSLGDDFAPGAVAIFTNRN